MRPHTRRVCRRRGKKLWENGHVDVHTFRVRHGRLITNDHRIVIFNAVVTASQRSRAYNTTVVYDSVDNAIINVMTSVCECVVGLGPGCSHQLAVVLTAVCLSKLRNAQELKKLPSHIVAVQRTAMTLDYAYGYNSRNTLLSKVRLPHAVRARAASQPGRDPRCHTLKESLKAGGCKLHVATPPTTATWPRYLQILTL